MVKSEMALIMVPPVTIAADSVPPRSSKTSDQDLQLRRPLPGDDFDRNAQRCAEAITQRFCGMFGVLPART
jgi:hypothetical protein